MHCVLSFRCPMNVCFDSSKGAFVVFVDELASADPIRPIIVRAYSFCILEGNTKGFGRFKVRDRDHRVAPCCVGLWCVMSLVGVECVGYLRCG